jgi:hypothetical protein
MQLVVVSPLMRTCETAAGVFGLESTSNSQPLMLAKTAEPRERSAHRAIAKPGNLPFLAEELCRERMSARPCSCQGLPASTL